MQSRSRSRKLSRSSSAKNSFKSASILEHGGQSPLKLDKSSTNTAAQEEIELVPRESRPSVVSYDPEPPHTGFPRTGGIASTPGTIPRISTTSDPAVEPSGAHMNTDASVRHEDPPHARLGLKTDQHRERSTQSGKSIGLSTLHNRHLTRYHVQPP